MDPDLKEYLKRPDVHNVADDVMGEGAADSMLKPTVNIGTIKGGVKINMIPSFCVFEADIRLPIGLEKMTVLAKIDDVLKDTPECSYEIQDAATNPSAASSRDHELVELLQKNTEVVRGKKALPISSLGGTDCKHFRYKAVPAYSYGPSPDTMAEKDEKVRMTTTLSFVRPNDLSNGNTFCGFDSELKTNFIEHLLTLLSRCL